MVFHTKLLQSSISQLSDNHKLEVFLALFFNISHGVDEASKRHKCRRPKKSAKNDNERSLAQAC